jgi:multiple sugar transport system permease protein
MSSASGGMVVAAEQSLARPSVLVRRTSFRRRKALVRLFRYAVVVLFLAFVLFPMFWIVGSSFKSPAELLSNPPVWMPRDPTLAHYRSVMREQGNAALRHSVAIGVGATLLSVVLGSLAAYSLARFRTGGRHLAFWILSQRMMPPIVLVIPVFLLLTDLGKVDKRFGIDRYAPLIALYTVANLPFVIWMMRSYFAGVPTELEESALVDGATRWGVLWRITLPLALPGLIATATFAFIFSWTEFLFAVSFTRTEAVTLPVVVAGLLGQHPKWGQATALACVATAPVFVLGLLVQKHFVRGLTLGAVRG